MEAEVTADTPLARFIAEEKDRQGLSLRAVAQRGHMTPERLRYYVTRWPAEQLPSAEVLQGIADGLRAPLARVQAVALASVGQSSMGDLNAEQQTVVNVMAGLSPRAQRAIADVALRLAEEFKNPPE